MLSTELEIRRNLRVKSICSHMENKKTEMVAKVGLSLEKNEQPKNLLSVSAMNFFFGHRYVQFLDKKKHLEQSVEIAKYIKKNELLPNIDKVLAEKYPNISIVRRLILVVNLSFNEARQQPQNVPFCAQYRQRKNERLREKERE